MPKSRYSLIRDNVGLVVFVIGLILILVAQTFSLKLAKISVDQAIATIGSAIVFSGALQWMFENYSKPQLFREITNRALGSDRLANSGLCDFSGDSKDVDYSYEIEFGEDLTFAINYSPRLIEDYFEALKKRLIGRKNLTVIVLASPSLGFRYATEGDVDSSHIAPNICKIERYVRELSDLAPGLVELVRHENILKYSFVATREVVWFTLYRNSAGIATVPAIKVERSSRLHDFFWLDIENMKNETRGIG